MTDRQWQCIAVQWILMANNIHTCANIENQLGPNQATLRAQRPLLDLRARVVANFSSETRILGVVACWDEKHGAFGGPGVGTEI